MSITVKTSKGELKGEIVKENTHTVLVRLDCNNKIIKRHRRKHLSGEQ